MPGGAISRKEPKMQIYPLPDPQTLGDRVVQRATALLADDADLADEEVIWQAIGQAIDQLTQPFPGPDGEV